ncbi:MAG TPA: hypothetical protein VEC37_01780 [Bacillota bacterium]|nr:hypothetical protein [Bacillota bacterium]
MTTAEALTAAKNRLGLSGTAFDTQLTDFFDTAVDRLFPRVQKEVDVQTVTPTVDNYGEAEINLATVATPLDDVRLVEAYQSSTWWPADKIFRHGTKLRVRDLPTDVSSIRLYGLKKYVVASAAVDIPEWCELPVIWFMMSEFYDYLAGSKSGYNIYSQTPGARAVDNMRDESEYYEQKAEQYIEEKAQLYGAQ